MSDTIVVEAELREDTGRRASRRLRREGKVPGIIYGGDKQDLPIAMPFFEISKLVEDEHFHTSLLEVKVKGSRGKNTVLLKDAQWDPIKDTVTHLDFFRVSAKDTVTVEVPVNAVNFEKCPGVTAGGMIDVIRRHLVVQCRADAMPESIDIDCSKLNIGDSIHILEAELPEGVTTNEAELNKAGEEVVNFTILTCVPPTVEKAAAEAEETTEE